MPEVGSEPLDAEYTYLIRTERAFGRTGAQRDSYHGQSDHHYSSGDDGGMLGKRNPKGPQFSAEEQRGYSSHAHAKP